MTIFQEKSNTYHISEPIIGRFFQNFAFVCSLRSSFIHSFSSAKKRCNTLQGFGAFFGQSCDRDRFLFPFTSEFLTISGCVFNNKNVKTIILLGLAGPNNYNHFGAMRPVGYLSYPYANFRTTRARYPRAFMTLRVAQFSLKIALLSFSMGPRGPRAYGLRPRLWLLNIYIPLLRTNYYTSRSVHLNCSV